jgi:hypothetical protein
LMLGFFKPWNLANPDLGPCNLAPWDFNVAKFWFWNLEP